MKDSLDNLHPIYIPPDVGFFPLSDGYIAVLILLASVFISMAAFGIVAFRKNRFKREALRELKKMQKDFTPAALFLLLKRVALSADKRQNVAQLSSKALLEYFLLASEAVVLKAQQSVYDKNITLSEDEKNELYSLVKKAMKEVRYVRD